MDDTTKNGNEAFEDAPETKKGGKDNNEVGRGKKTVSLTKREKELILDKWEHICAYCYGPADQVDHVIPQAFMVDHSNENLVACCWLCNLIASDKVFRSIHQKTKYIMDRRYKFIENNVIPLWLKSEVRELGPVIRKLVEKSCVVLDTEEDLEKTKRYLLSEGWRVTSASGEVVRVKKA